MLMFERRHTATDDIKIGRRHEPSSTILGIKPHGHGFVRCEKWKLDYSRHLFRLLNQTLELKIECFTWKTRKATGFLPARRAMPGSAPMPAGSPPGWPEPVFSVPAEPGATVQRSWPKRLVASRGR